MHGQTANSNVTAPLNAHKKGATNQKSAGHNSQSSHPESAGLNSQSVQSVSPESAGLNSQSVSPESEGLNSSVSQSRVPQKGPLRFEDNETHWECYKGTHVNRRETKATKDSNR